MHKTFKIKKPIEDKTSEIKKPRSTKQKKNKKTYRNACQAFGNLAKVVGKLAEIVGKLVNFVGKHRSPNLPGFRMFAALRFFWRPNKSNALISYFLSLSP